MTRCVVYRSSNTQFTYVYVREELALEDLPPDLLKLLGEPEKVMDLDLGKRNALAKEDIQRVRSNLAEKGYHLQLPPDEDPSGWLDLPPRKS